MSERAAARGALRSVRRVLRGRAGLPSRNDLAYGVYLTIMIVIIVVAPAVRAAILALAEVLPASIPPGAFATAGAVLAAAIALAALAGAQTGPAHARLPEIDLLHTSALPRALLLARPLRRSFLVAALVGMLLGGALLAAHAVQSGLDPIVAVAVLTGAAGAGLLAAVSMLLGQLGRGPRWGLSAAFGLLAAVLAMMSASSVVPPPIPSLPIPLLLLVLGVAAALCSPAIARCLRRDTMREQAMRMNAVSALALTGELRMAAARLGAPVRTGRGWRWRAPRGIGAAILSRDLLGVVRTPARSLAALLAMAGVGVLLGSVVFTGVGPVLAAPLGAAALLIAYAAIGPWCRGLRSGAETVGGSPLTPLSPAGLLLRHLVVPGVLSVLVVGGAASAGAALAGASPAAGLAGAVIALVALLLRLIGALKGPLPQSLLAPVPTPAGDMSGMVVLAWSLDGVIAAALLGGLLASVFAASAFAGIVVAAIVLAVLALWAGGRLRGASATG